MNLLLIKLMALVPVKPSGLPQASASSNNITSILNIAFAILGGFAVVMVVVSGLRYILSAGDPQKMSKAKSGIIYSLVGLVIAITAEAIVGFIGNRL